MPELPEVETIRRGLEKHLIGRVIENVEIRLPKMMTGDVEKVKGALITQVRRFGKGLLIDLNNDYSIAIHVKMTGQLVYQGVGIPQSSVLDLAKVGKLPGKHTHVVFVLRAKPPKASLASSGNKGQRKDYLYYNDIRQFGWLKVVLTDKAGELEFFKSLGPEPLRNLTIEQFSTILRNSKGPIKPLLMEQKKIAGIGNIYANDALYLAKIHPKQPANSLGEKETARLFDAIEVVLKKGIEVGGASEWQYVNALGESGGYQNFFQVYGQNGNSCKRCGAKIAKIVMGGRGTFFCPHCQQLTESCTG